MNADQMTTLTDAEAKADTEAVRDAIVEEHEGLPSVCMAGALMTTPTRRSSRHNSPQ